MQVLCHSSSRTFHSQKDLLSVYNDIKQWCGLRFDVMYWFWASGCPKVLSLSLWCLLFFMESQIVSGYIQVLTVCQSHQINNEAYFISQVNLYACLSSSIISGHLLLHLEIKTSDVSVEMSPQAAFALPFNGLQCFQCRRSYHPKLKALYLRCKCKFRFWKKMWPPSIQMRNGDFLQLA